MKKRARQVAKEDFIPEYLPRNRKEQFKFILRTRKSMLFRLGIILLVFAIPFIVTMVVKSAFNYNTFLLYQGGSVSEEQYVYLSTLNIALLSSIGALTLFILMIGLSGTLYIYKKLAFGEPVFFWNYFKKGIKINIKANLLITFVLFILILILDALLFFLNFSFYFIIILIFSVVLILPFFFNLYVYKSIYTSNVKESLKNCSILYLIMNFKAIGLTIGYIAIPLATIFLSDFLVITSITSLVILVLYFLLFTPFYLLALYLVYVSVLDEKLNINSFPNLYHKGLYDISMDDPRKE